jgi:hypothetical protein
LGLCAAAHSITQGRSTCTRGYVCNAGSQAQQQRTHTITQTDRDTHGPKSTTLRTRSHCRQAWVPKYYGFKLVLRPPRAVSHGGTWPKCNFTGTSSWSTRTSLTPRLDARPGGYGRRVQGRHHSGQSGSKGVRLQCLRLPRSGATTLGARGPRGCLSTILLELLPSQVEVKMQAGEGGSGSGGGPGCGAPQAEVQVPCLRDTHIPPTPIPHPTTTTYTTPLSPSPHPPPISIHSSVHGRLLPACRYGPLVAHKKRASS